MKLPFKRIRNVTNALEMQKSIATSKKFFEQLNKRKTKKFKKNYELKIKKFKKGHKNGQIEKINI